MDTLASVTAFVEVVDAGSFTAAAEALGTAKSQVSKHISQLENHLGTRLMQRTTRRLRLTEAGRIYHAHALRILETVRTGELAVAACHDVPHGRLRLSLPRGLREARFLDLLPRFMTLYPEVVPEISVTGRFVNLLEENLDLAVRIGHLADSSLVARRLGATALRVVASPKYWQQFGRPTQPDDLLNHHCLIYTERPEPYRWQFRAPDGQQFSVHIKARMAADDGPLLHRCAIAGQGVMQVPEVIVHEDLRAGRLAVMLEEFEQTEMGIYAVYPSAKHLSVNVRAFVEFLVEAWSTAQ